MIRLGGGVVYTGAILIPGKTERKKERKEKRWEGNIYG